jgi:hypothetical protein
MRDVEQFALTILITAAAVVAAVLSNRLSERIRIPAPAHPGTAPRPGRHRRRTGRRGRPGRT